MSPVCGIFFTDFYANNIVLLIYLIIELGVIVIVRVQKLAIIIHRCVWVGSEKRKLDRYDVQTAQNHIGVFRMCSLKLIKIKTD